MIEYTRKELDRLAPNDVVLQKLMTARELGDVEAQMNIFRELILPPVALLVLKETMGAEWIIEQGLNTSEADIKFGPGWMERDNDELAKLLHS